MFDFVIAEVLLCAFAFEKAYWNEIDRRASQMPELTRKIGRIETKSSKI
jgi:hypothetical protein